MQPSSSSLAASKRGEDGSSSSKIGRVLSANPQQALNEHPGGVQDSSPGVERESASATTPGNARKTSAAIFPRMQAAPMAPVQTGANVIYGLSSAMPPETDCT